MAMSAKHLIYTIESEVGTVGGGKYWRELGYGSAWDSYAWCCVFVLVMLRREGFKIGNGYLNCGNDSSGLQTGLKSIGAYQVDVALAKPGDVLIFDFAPKGGFDHTGFCTANNGNGYLQTCEGNVSNSVGDRTRALSDVRQCWRIPYDSEADAGYTGWWWNEAGTKCYHYTKGKLDCNKWVKGTGDWSEWWYHTGSDGAFEVSTWVAYNGKYYYVDATGKAASNCVVQGSGKYKGKYYYLGVDGTPVKNAWKKVNGEWYYFGSGGAMVVGSIIKYKNNWYCLGSDGALVTNQTIKFVADSDGILKYTK